MTLSTLDPKTALIVIDLQNGIVAQPCAHPMDAVVANAVELLRSFRAARLPVVLVNVAGGAPGRTEQKRTLQDLPADWAELLPQLGNGPDDHRVTKRTWGAFTGTDLADHLRRNGVTQVVLAGVATSIGVESTARQAHELGFNVALAVDAMTDMRAEAHENSVARIFPRLGETARSADIVALLAARA